MQEDVVTFLNVLDTENTSVGGGAACAISGAMAGALVAMVARLSIGKDGMKTESFYRKIITEAETLSDDLFSGGHEDERAFAAIRAAYRLPKNTPEEKLARRQAIQAATIEAARVPLRNSSICCRVLGLVNELSECSNPNAASDLQCAQYLARAGVLGCAANVFANVVSIEDATVASELANEAHRLELLTE